MNATIERREKGEGRREKGEGKQIANCKLKKANCKSRNGNGKTSAGDIIRANALRQTWNLDWPVERIDPCPFQPRQDFPAAELRAFADEIARDGLLQPLSVRPGGAHRFLGGNPLDCERYELVDGERRLRAVKLLGWTQVPVRMAVYTDAEVRALALASALQRKELNAIEEARAFKAAIDAGDAAGPTELAKQLGLSQGHVSNRLRLLELPEKAQAAVISREITPTQARELVPLKSAPAAIAAALKEVEREKRDQGADILTTDQFMDAVYYAVGEVCREIRSDDAYDQRSHCSIPPMRPTDGQLAELNVVELPPQWKGAKPRRFAANVKLYDELYEAHKAAAIERAAKKRLRREEKGAARDGGRGKGDDKKTLSPAEKKRRAAEELAAAKERAEKLARGVWHVAVDWRRALIAEDCLHEQVCPEDAARLLLFCGATAACLREGNYISNHEISRREDVLSDLLRAKTRRGAPDLWTALVGVADRDVLTKALRYLANRFWDPDQGGEATIDDEDVMAIVEHLGIQLAAAWKNDALGPDLTERWLELRTKDQLADLAAAWKIKGAGEKKSELVAALLKAAKSAKPPAELLKPKKPKS